MAKKYTWKVQQMCKVLSVTESGYYKSIRNRERLTKRKLWHKTISWFKNRYSYTCSYRIIVRICLENGLVIKQNRHPNNITRADAAVQKAENLINQDFSASTPNEKWLTVSTEIPCSDANLYLAPVFDCYYRCIRCLLS